MGVNELKLLAKKYLDGTATAEEKNQLNLWYDNALEKDEDEIITGENRTELKIKQHIFKDIQKRKQTFDLSARTKNRNRNVKLWIGVASTAAVLALGYYGLLINTKSTVNPHQVQLVSTPKNKISQLTMPDGSKVWLNAGAVFKYPKKFTGKTRTVELLKGRVFFDIKHLSNHPFVVKTKGMNIVVLGTSFDVNSDEKTNLTSVSVVTGKVGITMTNPKNKQPAVILLPHQQAILSNTTNAIKTQAVKETNVQQAWYQNNFVFEQEKMADVFNALSKEYGIKIKVENKKLLTEPISITLNNQHIDTIMKVLSFSKHFKYYSANDSTIIIK